MKERIEVGDLLAFLFTVVLLREAFWWSPEAFAWGASFGVAAFLGFLRIGTRGPRPALPAPFWLAVVLPLGLYWAVHLPYPDVGYDAFNYHFLHGERAARGLLAIPGDFFPFMFPYLNPAPDILNALLRWALGYRLGTVGGLLALIWTGAILYRALESAIPSQRLRAVATLWIVGAEGMLWEVGNYMVDLYGLPLLLEAALIALPGEERDESPVGELTLFGLLLGSAVAFKLTNLVFAAAIGVVLLARLLFVPAPGRRRERLALGLALSAAAFVLPNLPHTLYLWRTTGSPVFPHYNAFFRSPLFPTFNIRDGRFGPRTTLEALAWPVTSALHPARLSELARTSGRIALGFLGAILALAIRPRDLRLGGLSVIVILGAVLWSFGAGNHRYGLFVELAGGLLLVILACHGLAAASGKGETARRLAAVPLVLFGAQSLLVLLCLWPGDWGGRATIFSSPRHALRELRFVGSDRDLVRELPKFFRDAMPTIAGWVDAAPRTNGLMALIAPRLPMIGLRLDNVFDVPANLVRFSNAVRPLQRRRLVSLAAEEDVADARKELARRGFHVRGEYPFELPFFSGYTKLDLVAFDLTAPRPLPSGPGDLARILGTCRRDDLLTGGLNLEEEAVVHGPLVVQGWARIPGEDLEARVLIDGEERVPGPAARYPRPDVCATLPEMGDCAKAGFEVRLDFEEEDEGRHEITAIFLSRDGRCRIYPVIPFTWMP